MTPEAAPESGPRTMAGRALLAAPTVNLRKAIMRIEAEAAAGTALDVMAFAYRMLWESYSQADDWEQIIRQNYGEGPRAIGHTWLGRAAKALSDALGPEAAAAAKHPTYEEQKAARLAGESAGASITDPSDEGLDDMKDWLG